MDSREPSRYCIFESSKSGMNDLLGSPSCSLYFLLKSTLFFDSIIEINSKIIENRPIFVHIEFLCLKSSRQFNFLGGLFMVIDWLEPEFMSSILRDVYSIVRIEQRSRGDFQIYRIALYVRNAVK